MDLYGCCKFGSLYNCYTRRITDVSVYNRTTRYIFVLDYILIDSIGNGVLICDIEGCIKSKCKPSCGNYFHNSERLPYIWLSCCPLISTPIVACSFYSYCYSINHLVCMEVAQKISIKSRHII